MTTYNRRTQISKQSPSNVENRKRSKDQKVLETSLNEVGVHSDGGQVKDVLVTIINLVVNSGDAKAMVRHLREAVELREQH
jgi:hypothetical protein